MSATNPRTIAEWKAFAAEQADSIASLKRSQLANTAWIRGLDRQDGTETFDVIGTDMSVTIMGVRRADGGVARVRVGSTALLPEMLDDLLAKWLTDRDPMLRAAARRIAAWVTAVNNSPFPAELTGGAS